MSKKIHVRPGKSQSRAGFVVGILFCLIGVFMVIPIFGIFGIFWTAIAGWITFSHYRNGFTNKQIDSQVIEIEEDGEDVTVTSHAGFRSYSYETENDASEKEDVEERLRKLQSLYDQALITREEYEQKKKEILEEL
ncbi:MAG: SHOCT domain-containing protein [Lachnospiraceae bacterium]|nr:SHOCT domain-containing protein [Lachnospiraceae bacterium]